MKVGDVVAERFEVREVPRWGHVYGVDRTNGERVVIFRTFEALFLDHFAMRAAGEIAMRLRDPRIAPVLHLDPLIAGVGAKASECPAPVRAAAGLAILELATTLTPLGLVAAWDIASIPDDAPVRVPVVPARTDLHYGWRSPPPYANLSVWVSPVARRRRSAAPDTSSPRALGAAFADLVDSKQREDSHARASRLPAVWATAPIVAMDLDGAIAAGERVLLERERHPGGLEITRWPLAAALHHRGCLRHARGEHGAALADVARAVALDDHPRTVTTLALLHEHQGDDAAAGDAHERAVDGLARITPVFDGTGIDVIETGQDHPDAARAHAARCVHARGVFRARTGDADGARADLTRASTLGAGVAAERWLAYLASRPTA